MRLVTLTLVAIALLGGTALTADAAVTDPNGISGLEQINVEFGTVELADQCNAHGLRTRVERRLANAGFDLDDGDAVPLLEINIDLRLVNRSLVVGTVTMELSQGVTLERDATIAATGVTWSTTNLLISVASEGVLKNSIEQTLDNQVAAFISTHREVNGRMAPQEESLLERLWPF